MSEAGTTTEGRKRFGRLRRGGRLVLGALVLATTLPLVALLMTVWVNGWRISSVQSSSMAPTIPRGAAVVVAPVSGDEIGVGTVIAYTDPNDRGRTVIHRVLRVVDRPGARSFETQGDANAVPDRDLVPMRLVQGEVERHVLGLGAVVDWVSDADHAGMLIAGSVALLAANELSAARQRRRVRSEASEVMVLRQRIAELEMSMVPAEGPLQPGGIRWT